VPMSRIRHICENKQKVQAAAWELCPAPIV